MPKCRQVRAAFVPCSSYQSIMPSRCFASLESSRARTALTARGMFSQKFLIPAITHVYGIYLNEIREKCYRRGAGLLLRSRRRAEAQPNPQGGLEVSQPLVFGQAARKTALHVAVHDQQAHLGQTAAGRHQLRQHALTHPVLRPHAAAAADLPFDATEPGKEGLRV